MILPMTPLRATVCRACRRSQAHVRRGFATVGRTQTPDNRVRIVEVGPRDGLQNEKGTIPLETKMELISRLARTGLSTIEAGSFVSPKWVPQMANSGEILGRLLRGGRGEEKVPVTYSFLAPNMKGFEAMEKVLRENGYDGDAGTNKDGHNKDSSSSSSSSKDGSKDGSKGGKPGIEIAVFAAATESFTQRNLNCDIQTSLERFKAVIRAAKSSGLGVRVRAYISVVLGCPFEGFDVDPHRVAEIATDLLESGADEISLGDTTGMGTAPRTGALLRCMAAAGIRNEDVAMHFHDTYGQALVNTAVSLEHGIRTFDSSVGGLGGCPYSPGATGNAATENMVYFMETLGMETGVDLDAVADIGAWITGELGKGNESSVGKAVLGARARRAAEGQQV